MMTYVLCILGGFLAYVTAIMVVPAAAATPDLPKGLADSPFHVGLRATIERLRLAALAGAWILVVWNCVQIVILEATRAQGSSNPDWWWGMRFSSILSLLPLLLAVLARSETLTLQKDIDAFGREEREADERARATGVVLAFRRPSDDIRPN